MQPYDRRPSNIEAASRRPDNPFDPRSVMRDVREARYAFPSSRMEYRVPVRLAFAVLGLIGLLSFGCGGSSSGSVGAVFGRDNDTRALYVREVPPGLAAASAGLRPGDQVMMIDGLFVRDLEPKAIREKLRGEAGSTVALTILRGEEVLHLNVARGTVGGQKLLPPRETRFSE